MEETTQQFKKQVKMQMIKES